MKKSILNLGKTLNKAQQKEINGGTLGQCLVYCWNTYSNNLPELFDCENDCSIAYGGIY